MDKNIPSQKQILINLEEPIIFDHVQNGVTITDQRSTILYTNSRFTAITGYSKDEAKGENPGILHSGRHDEKFYNEMWSSLKNNGFWEGEIWNRRKSGEVYPEYLTISEVNDINSNQIYYVAIFSDISYLKKDLSKKIHLAFYDPLTELPNRNLFIDRANNAIEQVIDENNKTFAILFMDLDKFKQANDEYGHLVGDKLLHVVGNRISSVLRHGDTVARMGGDEFTAILESNCDKQLALNLAKRIKEAIDKPFVIDGHEINVSISIGVTLYSPEIKELKDLLDKADKAMYKAKQNKTGIEFYA